MTRERRRRRGLGWTGLVGAVAALGALGLSDGQVGVRSELRGIEVVHWTSRSNRDDFKRAFAKCPDGKTVIGGGGRVFVASPIDAGDPSSARAGRAVHRMDDIGLLVSAPSQDMDGWAVTAQAIHPNVRRQTNWFVSASAVCADAIGLESVQQSTKTDAAGFKRVFASCPDGTRVLGGGGRVFVPSPNQPGARPLLDGILGLVGIVRNPLPRPLPLPPPDHPIGLAMSAPSADLDGWAVTARTMRLQDRQTPWFASASAVCGTVSDLEVVEWSSASDTTDFKRAFAKCPDGSTVVAGGGRVFTAPSRPGGDPARMDSIPPDESPPPDDQIGLTVSVPSADMDGWAVTAQAMRPRARETSWFVTASAVCARAPAGTVR